MNNEVKLIGDEIQEYPKLTKFEPIIVRVQKINEYNGQMTATDWELASN